MAIVKKGNHTYCDCLDSTTEFKTEQLATMNAFDKKLHTTGVTEREIAQYRSHRTRA